MLPGDIPAYGENPAELCRERMDQREPIALAGTSVERRASPRVSCEVWVEELVTRRRYVHRVENLGVGGLLLRHYRARVEGSLCGLRLQLPDGQPPLSVKSQVVAVRRLGCSFAVGLRFLELSPAEQERLAAFVERVRCELPASAFPEALREAPGLAAFAPEAEEAAEPAERLTLAARRGAGAGLEPRPRPRAPRAPKG